MSSVAPNTADFEPLREQFLASAWRLSAQAGWNQTEEDWGRLVRMDGSSVKVLIKDGEVRASYSVVGYGTKVAWIGMVLVDEALRGEGWGKAAFAAALHDAAGFETAGLDATNLGEPIYLKQGFEIGGPVVRWMGVSRRDSAPARPLRTGMHEDVVALDAASVGINRAELLRDLAGSGAAVFRLDEGGATSAYGIVRPGRLASHLGPVVAGSPEGFAAVLDQALAFCQGEPLICDAVCTDAANILASRGLRPARFLKRMTRPLDAGCLAGPEVWCGAGFELG